jgi:hypothetical protein
MNRLMRLIESGQLRLRRWLEHISSLERSVFEKILDIEFALYQVSKDFEAHPSFQFPKERSCETSL